MSTLLKVEDLIVGYGDVDVIRNVGFSVEEGEILGIVGESGCGKSTLFFAIMNLQETGVIVRNGKITFKGTDILSLNTEEMRQLRGAGLGVIFQNPGASFNPTRKIITQFIETMQSHMRIDKKDAHDKIMDLLLRLNLKDGERILNSYPFELSGGMNQRVAIALAMIMEPDLILADEPTSALDVTVQKQVVEEMMKLRDNFGKSIIIITHNMGVAAKMADNIGVMYAGRLIEYGDKEKILHSARHPYTRALLSSIPQVSGGLPKGLDGRPPTFSEHIQGCCFYERCKLRSDVCKVHEHGLQLVEDRHWSNCQRV